MYLSDEFETFTSLPPFLFISFCCEIISEKKHKEERINYFRLETRTNGEIFHKQKTSLCEDIHKEKKGEPSSMKGQKKQNKHKGVGSIREPGARR